MIYLLPNLVDDFKKSYPMHKMNNVYTVAFKYDYRGDLIDYKILDVNNKWINGNEYGQTNPDSLSALSTLSHLIKDM